MKRLVMLVFALLLSINTFAQTEKDAFWTIRNEGNEYRIGGYIGAGARYSGLGVKSAGFLDIKAAVTLNGKYAIGVSASGLYYDKKLNELVSDGTYHLYAGYTGLFFERIISLSDNTKLSLSILSGAGEAYYQYDKDYRENRPWYQEVIDKEIFFVTEPGIELQQRISSHMFIGINGSYRFTSPLNLVNTDSKLLQSFTGGITFKYGIF